MRRILLPGVPLLLAGLLVGGDAVARQVVEDRVATAVTTLVAGAQHVEVDIGGWPLAPDLVYGELHDVTVRAIVPFSDVRKLLLRGQGTAASTGFDLKDVELVAGGLQLTVHADRLAIP